MPITSRTDGFFYLSICACLLERYQMNEPSAGDKAVDISRMRTLP